MKDVLCELYIAKRQHYTEEEIKENGANKPTIYHNDYERDLEGEKFLQKFISKGLLPREKDRLLWFVDCPDVEQCAISHICFAVKDDQPMIMVFAVESEENEDSWINQI